MELKPVIDVPPDQKAKQRSRKPISYQIDAVQHLGARRAGKRLRDAEQLLVDLLVDPFCLLDEFHVELPAMFN